MARPLDNASHALREQIRRIEPYDTGLLLSVLMLLGLGTVVVFSATIHTDYMATGDGTVTLRRHLIHVGLGIGTLVVGMMVPYRHWKKLVYPILAGVVILLLLVLEFGTTVGNARRWLAFPGFKVQPAEMAKLAFVLFLSYSLAKKGPSIQKFTVAWLPHTAVCALLILLCLSQPDFGTSILLVLIMFGMLFVAGTRLAYITLFSCVGGFLAFQAIANNNMRLTRVMMWLDPWGHRQDGGYQMVNSLIAIGSGGTAGQSLGFGGQTLTGFLPEGETDFILSVIAEQLGFFGVLVVVALFGTLLLRGTTTALHAQDHFGRFLAFGITFLLSLQATINMLVAVTLIPTKGLTLPFISYGGSSMIVCCFAVGILLSISRDIRMGRMQLLASVESEPVEVPA